MLVGSDGSDGSAPQTRPCGYERRHHGPKTRSSFLRVCQKRPRTACEAYTASRSDAGSSCAVFKTAQTGRFSGKL